MPIREFKHCGKVIEVIHPSLDSSKVPPPACARCGAEMELMISLPRIDTSSTFKAFTWRGPTGLYHEIDNLHALRQVEHAYLATGHNVRFDAYSAEPSNPNAVDGMGMEYWDGDKNKTTKTHIEMGGDKNGTSDKGTNNEGVGVASASD